MQTSDMEFVVPLASTACSHLTIPPLSSGQCCSQALLLVWPLGGSSASASTCAPEEIKVVSRPSGRLAKAELPSRKERATGKSCAAAAKPTRETVFGSQKTHSFAQCSCAPLCTAHSLHSFLCALFCAIFSVHNSLCAFRSSLCAFQCAFHCAASFARTRPKQHS